ncbi:MAG: DUF2961 domain-containing protein [Chloroflexi bacterium]|nr:DUF2961 domain-containing protein [Chloroflexota bacterium]
MPLVMRLKKPLSACLILVWFVVACTPVPIPTAVAPQKATLPRPVTTPQSVIVAPQSTPTPTSTPANPTTTLARTIEGEHKTTTPTATPPPTPTPTPISFLQQRITNLFDLARLPLLENSSTTQFTSRNWVALEHYFDYFIDDGNFVGPHYGYIDETGALQPYRIVTGYDGAPEYEIVPRVEGPGSVERIWFAYQQHQSINNPKDMSHDDDWSNWGNLGAMGNVRFYFDDEPTPRIDFTVKNLFVGKNPFPEPLAAFYAAANGGNINYVPVPFQRSIRITTTGRPRLMQIQIKRFAASVASFSPNLSNGEQAALDQAAQAWRSCAPALPPKFESFALAVPHNDSAEVDFNAPATIAGLRVRIPRVMEDSVWMQVFWDGENEPSMIAPLRAMFGTGERLLPYRSLPMGIISTADELVFYNNFPMPFQSARIVFVNGRAETLPVTLEVALRETLPGTERSRLHAFYGTRRMERREDDRDNYIAIDVPGSGKYLGTIFSAWELDRGALNGPLSPNWRFPYLESNVDVWVDGRLALPGTGIEDDFNASYYYVFAGYEGYNTTFCLAGLTLLDYGTPKEPSSQYRFYFNDAPEFRDRLRVEVQHGNKGNNLSVTYSSTAFCYQVR